MKAKLLWYGWVVTALLAVSHIAHSESDYATAWGPGVGTTAPVLAATDQHGSEQTFETLKGTNGLLFVFNRSVDW